ncbi:protein FAM163A [Sorex fumeus]|uniref:protein FAM163A n=1 Tax=Sorex fumeus TaxID=62283 RepID=UPI0024AD71BD|nr:protein FAM163A [Sorex fumeus]
MTAGTVVITGGILAAVILLCIIAVLCYCRLQYYCCKKSGVDDAAEEDEEGPRGLACNACSSRADPLGGLAPLPSEPRASPCPTCSPHGSAFYIRTADLVPNGGSERLTLAPAYYKEGAPPPFKVAAPQPFPVTWPSSARDAFTNPRAVSTDV